MGVETCEETEGVTPCYDKQDGEGPVYPAGFRQFVLTQYSEPPICVFVPGSRDKKVKTSVFTSTVRRDARIWTLMFGSESECRTVPGTKARRTPRLILSIGVSKSGERPWRAT